MRVQNEKSTSTGAIFETNLALDKLQEFHSGN